MTQPTIWLVNPPILFLYVAAVAMVLLLRSANDRICSSSSKEKPMPPVVIVALTLVSNLLGVASLVLLANALSSPTRWSMLALPLLVLIVRYGRIIYREPKKRPASATALAGSTAGLVTGGWLFMRNIVTTEPIASVAIRRQRRDGPPPKAAGTRGAGRSQASSWSCSISSPSRSSSACTPCSRGRPRS